MKEALFTRIASAILAGGTYVYEEAGTLISAGQHSRLLRHFTEDPVEYATSFDLVAVGKSALNKPEGYRVMATRRHIHANIFDG